jgi:hypothetical protein
MVEKNYATQLKQFRDDVTEDIVRYLIKGKENNEIVIVRDLKYFIYTHKREVKTLKVVKKNKNRPFRGDDKLEIFFKTDGSGQYKEVMEYVSTDELVKIYHSLMSDNVIDIPEYKVKL